MAENTDITLPSWITREVLEKTLQVHNNSAKLIDYKVSLGCKPDEHFMSVMFKVSLNYRTPACDEIQTLYTIIKTVPETEGRRKEFVEKTPCFKNELRVYERILPRMQTLLSAVGDNVKIAPRLFYQSRNPVPAIILEDLSPEGYRTFVHPAKFDISKNIALLLGKFHAVSMVLHESGVELSDFVDTDFDSKNEEFDFVTAYLLPTFKFLIEECRSWPEFNSYVPRLEKLVPSYLERLEEHFLQRDKSLFKVLVHGDFHYTNIMYRGEGTDIKDLVLIDYQFVLWNSPAQDVYALINLMSNAEAREHNREDLIKLYFAEFKATLNRLEYKGVAPSFNDLQSELERSTFLDLMQTTGLVPFQYIDVDSKEFYEAEGALTERIKLGIRNPQYRSYLSRHIERILVAVENNEK